MTTERLPSIESIKRRANKEIERASAAIQQKNDEMQALVKDYRRWTNILANLEYEDPALAHIAFESPLRDGAYPKLLVRESAPTGTSDAPEEEDWRETLAKAEAEAEVAVAPPALSVATCHPPKHYFPGASPLPIGAPCFCGARQWGVDPQKAKVEHDQPT